MGQKVIATDELARHLHAAIERVRADMERVEFWADAMTSFSEPVPDYSEDDVKVWLPSEQARTISSAKKEGPQKRPQSRKRHQ
jgi:hypothetical protein